MTTPTLSNEAVEAAMCFIDGRGRVHWNNAACFLLSIATDEDHESGCPQTHAAARILAAEVERLRAELAARHTEYAKALNKRVDVENELARIGAGKRDLPTREECRMWALKLGNA